MTNDEAVDMLKHCLVEHDCHDFKYRHCDGCNQRIAQDMAIKSLKANANAIPISFIEEQIKECEKYDYPNIAKIFTALIKMWDNVKAEWERKEE